MSGYNDEKTAVARDAARWRWLVSQHNVLDLPIAQVVWKRGSDPYGEWVNLIDGNDLIAHVDHAICQPSPLPSEGEMRKEMEE